MKFIVSIQLLFLVCLWMNVSAAPKRLKNPSPTKKLKSVTVKTDINYGELRNSVFVKNKNFYGELKLDKWYQLEYSTFAKHCGSDAVGLISNSTGESIPVVNGFFYPKFPPGWEVFGSYNCVYGESSPSTSPSTLPSTSLTDQFSPSCTIKTSENDGLRNMIEQLKAKVKEMANNQKKLIADYEKEILKLRVAMEERTANDEEKELKDGILNLGEAASLKRNLDYGDFMEETDYSSRKDLAGLEEILEQKRHVIAHGYKACDQLEKDVDKVVKAYRYLVCTGRSDRAFKYAKQPLIDLLLIWKLNFHMRGKNTSLTL